MNESKDSEMIENFNQNVSTLSNLSLDEYQESKMVENIVRTGVPELEWKASPWVYLNDFLKNSPIKFPVPCEVPQLLRRKKAKSN